ncbi:unnamed protein product [Rhizoctonia solani]|uniref:Uncharacterized protein n=1 Tax=Rhizoctonia solani TaxID=456999 RepID=A0A8H3C444_9AGAM|nr:unnamed protein product [Rhizoctonia solani]
MWATAVGLDKDIKSSIPSSPTFQHLRDLKDLSNQFPAWLADANSPQFQFVSPAHRTVANEICTHLASRRLANPTSFCNDVDLQLTSLVVILIICQHMGSLATHSMKPTEADRRHSLDTLLAYICEADSSDTSVQYSAEQELKLPEAPFQNYNVTKTKADGVLRVGVPNFLPYVAHANMGVAATAFCHKAIDDTLQLVHCAVEFKREGDGSNQAMMAMVSGLYQRRVLQMSGQFVFGVLHSEKTRFRVVAGIWQENNIQLYEIGSYSMLFPAQAVQFYLVLRGIHRRASSYVQELRESQQNLTSQVLNNPPPAVWYPPRMGRIPEDPNESGQKPPHQGGANTQQETPEQRYARRKVQSYLKTTSSLTEFLPVDLPPDAPDRST